MAKKKQYKQYTQHGIIVTIKAQKEFAKMKKENITMFGKNTGVKSAYSYQKMLNEFKAERRVERYLITEQRRQQKKHGAYIDRVLKISEELNWSINKEDIKPDFLKNQITKYNKWMKSRGIEYRITKTTNVTAEDFRHAYNLIHFKIDTRNIESIFDRYMYIYGKLQAIQFINLFKLLDDRQRDFIFKYYNIDLDLAYKESWNYLISVVNTPSEHTKRDVKDAEEELRDREDNHNILMRQIKEYIDTLNNFKSTTKGGEYFERK